MRCSVVGGNELLKRVGSVAPELFGIEGEVDEI